MGSSKNRQDGLNTDHIVSGKDKRNEKRKKDLLRRVLDVNKDWENYDLDSKENRFKRNQKLD